MQKILTSVALIFALAGIAVGQSDSQFKFVPTVPKYTFMTVGVLGPDGARQDEKFFLGRLPRDGEEVEMVFVGRDEVSGDMRFQLRVKPSWRSWLDR